MQKNDSFHLFIINLGNVVADNSETEDKAVKKKKTNLLSGQLNGSCRFQFGNPYKTSGYTPYSINTL